MEITGAGASEQIYLSYRPLMFSLAYRMLGSVMDAEDVVQEAFLYANETNLDHVHNPKAYLCKIVTNRCIDNLRSASKKREVYVGPWLPEPLMTTGDRSFRSHLISRIHTKNRCPPRTFCCCSSCLGSSGRYSCFERFCSMNTMKSRRLWAKAARIAAKFSGGLRMR